MGGRRVMLVSAAALIAGLLLTAGATAAMRFSYGPVRYELSKPHCVFGNSETMVGGYLGAQINRRKRLPKVGQVFYVRVVVNRPGLSCGAEWTYADVALPPGLRPAISRRKPVRCFVRGASGKWVRARQAPDGSCGRNLGPSQTTHPRIRKWYGLNQVSGDVWTVPQGITYRFDLPVKASRAISRKNSCACVVGGFKTSSGDSKPENAWSFGRGLFPSRGPYGPLRVYPR
jgi:hypothetical protein